MKITDTLFSAKKNSKTYSSSKTLKTHFEQSGAVSAGGMQALVFFKRTASKLGTTATDALELCDVLPPFFNLTPPENGQTAFVVSFAIQMPLYCF